MNNNTLRTGKYESGAVLIVAMLLLLVLTLLGVMGLSSMTVEQRMAMGYQQTETAFDASQSVINQLILQSSKNTRLNVAPFTTVANGGYDVNKDLLVQSEDTTKWKPDPTNHCYRTHVPSTPIQIDSGTGAIIHGAVSTNVTMDVVGISQNPKDMPGFDAASDGSGFSVYLYDITADTSFLIGDNSAAARSSQTQRVALAVPGTNQNCTIKDFKPK